MHTVHAPSCSGERPPPQSPFAGDPPGMAGMHLVSRVVRTGRAVRLP